MQELTITGVLVAAVLALWKALEKTWDKMSEKRAERNGTSSKVHLETILDRLAALHERMDTRLANMEVITTARDDEGRPKTWFPEAVIKRTHEAVRTNGEILHEVVKGMGSNAEATRDNGRRIDDLKVAIQSHKGGA